MLRSIKLMDTAMQEFMIISRHRGTLYFLNRRQEGGMTAYFWSTESKRLARFNSYALAYQFYFPSRHLLLHCEIVELTETDTGIGLPEPQ